IQDQEAPEVKLLEHLSRGTKREGEPHGKARTQGDERRQPGGVCEYDDKNHQRQIESGTVGTRAGFAGYRYVHASTKREENRHGDHPRDQDRERGSTDKLEKARLRSAPE